MSHDKRPGKPVRRHKFKTGLRFGTRSAEIDDETTMDVDAEWEALQIARAMGVAQALASFKETAREQGASGGRPRTAEDNHDEWLRLFNEKREHNKVLSKSRIYELIGEGWKDEKGDPDPRAGTTVRDGIANARTRKPRR